MLYGTSPPDWACGIAIDGTNRNCLRGMRIVDELRRKTSAAAGIDLVKESAKIPSSTHNLLNSHGFWRKALPQECDDQFPNCQRERVVQSLSCLSVCLNCAGKELGYARPPSATLAV